MSCPAGLIELRNALKREIQDELEAYHRYREASVKLRHYGKERLADRLKDLSIDEKMHHYILEATVELITQECKE